jgi:hypothetical protein
MADIMGMWGSSSERGDERLCLAPVKVEERVLLHGALIENGHVQRILGTLKGRDCP